MAFGVITLKSAKGRNDSNATGRGGTTAIEIVLSQFADEAGSAEDERQGVNDRALAGTNGTYEYVVIPEADVCVLNSAKAVDSERK